ncbi:hypothetical protein J4N42_01950 [Vibrio sp. SCSIO 43135]|uniref:hypothetical protein n=1 Tax=Vibrio sp. SCSIO 43135 TaxID=2819096 RepID=UPI00207557CA|nr:hypothetical protein [Vibrio sp. SCSIO 43135]USD41517.1 hypothetical protein J4N42_01950 [Vibrio sp. SCSIO 43135]
MSRKNSSKQVLLDEDFYETPDAMVEPLHLDKLKLKCNGTTTYFIQLLYKGAPNYSQRGEKIEGVDYIPVAGRGAFVRDVYRILKTDFNRSKQGYFFELKKYIRWMDSNHLEPIDGDYFSSDLYIAFMNYQQERCSRGEQKLATWNSSKGMLSFFLRFNNRTAEAKQLKSIKGVKKQCTSHEGIDVDGEFKPLVRRFIAAFAKFRDHFLEGTKLDIHPLWSEELFNQQAVINEWSPREKAAYKHSFKSAIRSENSVRNHFSRLAAMLAFCFTGQNTTPLLNLRFSDIRFTTISNGKVYFDMTKARANYLNFDTSLGFHKKTQEFFHQWLEISMEFQKDSGTEWLFPYFKESGDIQGWVEAGQGSPQKHINIHTKKLGLVHVTPSKLRQTKIDTLMKVTQDIWVVSMSANNSIEVIGLNYSDGNKSDHRTSLAANGEALYDFSKNGTDPHEAANKSKFNHANVLSNYDYKRLRKEETANDTQTPLGVRCKDSSQGLATRIKKNLENMGVKQPKKEQRCTDFLGCFECPYHRLVSEVEDIWLMLSFNDTLEEMKDYPAINSLPTDKFYKLCNTIESILKDFKEVAPDSYTQALEMHSEAPHPLYSDGYSLMDLLETF